MATSVGHLISGSQVPPSPTIELVQRPPQSPPQRGFEPPLEQDASVNCRPPLKVLSWAKIPSLISMLLLLDNPGFIRRSLLDTQTRDIGKPWSTNIETWRKFSKTYAEDTNNVTLLATVLLAANMSFLAIQSIDSAPDGLSYLPQRFSYLSLFAALTCIVMGLAVRSPRLFTHYGSFYYQAIILVLGFPFETFLYSIVFFISALLSHCAKHQAVVELVFAGILAFLVLFCLTLYWLVTEPCNDIDSPHRRKHTTKDNTATKRVT